MVYELEAAVESYRLHKRPDVLVYRRTSDPPLRLDDKRERENQLNQLEALEAFMGRWFHHDDSTLKRAFHRYSTPDQFEQQLETHLRKLIREKLSREPSSRSTLGEGEIVFHGVPYPGLKAFGLEDAPVFYGRCTRGGLAESEGSS